MSLFKMPRLCRMLMVYRNIHEVIITVRFNFLNRRKTKLAWDQSLLDYLKEARGFGCATILDSQGKPFHSKLVKLMTTSFTTLQEVHDRASVYSQRAIHNEKLGRLSTGRCDYQDGFDFLCWSCYHFFDDMNSSIIHYKEDIAKRVY